MVGEHLKGMYSILVKAGHHNTKGMNWFQFWFVMALYISRFTRSSNWINQFSNFTNVQL